MIVVLQDILTIMYTLRERSLFMGGGAVQIRGGIIICYVIYLYKIMILQEIHALRPSPFIAHSQGEQGKLDCVES